MFALIVGIDKYVSNNIWNLRACAADARSFEQWLVGDLQVPRHNICTLLDREATKRNIEDKFVVHLLNNPSIRRRDAIIIYFAGHGSSIRAPDGWYERGRGDVSVLCANDHDTKLAQGGYNAGISDRSLNAMIRDLSQAKGDNITLILDSCFSLPPTEGANPKERRHIRYTPTTRAGPTDLLNGLWRGVVSQGAGAVTVRGFTGAVSQSHVVIAACPSGWAATERKDGGNFTRALMALKNARPIHKLTYLDLPLELATYMGDHQYAACTGTNADRILFDGVPFPPDHEFVAVNVQDKHHVLLAAGAMHGIREGATFTLYSHRYRGSVNTPMGSFLVIAVYPTSSLARPAPPVNLSLREGWAKITRWNNPPLRVHVKRTLFTFFRGLRLNRKLPSTPTNVPERGGFSVVRTSASRADLVVKLRRAHAVAERLDPLISSNCRRTIRIPSARTRAALQTVDAAARFHALLYRKHPARPLMGMVTLELFRLDPSTWARTSGNLLARGRAQIVDDERKSIYAVVIYNHSDVDLWPYLAYMDAGGYSVSTVYHPDPSAPAPPLRRHSYLVIGSGVTQSDALSFALSDGAESGAGFLKLFVSTAYTSMGLMEHSRSGEGLRGDPNGGLPRRETKSGAADGAVWDASLASITVTRRP